MSAPRSLTKQEIEDVLDFALPLQNNHMFIQKDPYAKHRMIEDIRANMKGQLRKIKLSPEAIPQLKDEMVKKLYRSLAQPGTLIGLIVAESFGQEVTQAVLNSKRMTGAGKDFSGGLAAMDSLLTGSKGAIFPAHISFTNPYYTAFDVYRFAARFTYTTLRSISKHKTSELIPIEEYEPEWWVDLYKQIHGDIPFNAQHVIRVVLNMDKVYENQVTMKSIVEAIENSSEGEYLYPVPSPLAIPEPYIDIFVNSIAIEDLVKLQTRGNSTGSVEIFHFNTFDSQDICIKGIPHVLKIKPNFVLTQDSIHLSQKLDVENLDKNTLRELKKAGGKKEMLQNLWYVKLDYEFMNKYGIPLDKVKRLLEASDIMIVPTYEDLIDEDDDEENVLIVKTKEDKKPELIIAETLEQANKDQDELFKDAIIRNAEMIPELSELYRLGKHFYAMVKMEREKDKQYNVLAPFSRYKIVDPTRSYAGDIYENLDFLGVIGLKTFLEMKIKDLIEGASGTAVQMHINIMVKYQTRMGNYTRFNLKGVEQEAGKWSSAALWKDVTRQFNYASAEGSQSAQNTWANTKLVNAEMRAGSHISGVLTDPESEAKYKKELEEQREILALTEEGKTLKEIEEIMKKKKEKEEDVEELSMEEKLKHMESKAKMKKEKELEYEGKKSGKKPATKASKAKPAAKRAVRKPKASKAKPAKMQIDIDDL